MPRLLQEVPPQEAVEYVLPLFRELVLDPDDTVQEEFSRSLGDVMWWFLTHCRVVVEDNGETDGNASLQAQIHHQTFTPLFGTLILSSNGSVSETARLSITTVLERIKTADDKDTLARGDHVRPPLPPENLWKAPAQDYAMDDPEIQEEEPEIGLFGPVERTKIKQEILAAIVVALGRLDLRWEDEGSEKPLANTGHNVDKRRSFSTPSSTSSTPSTSNSAHSSSGSSPTVPPAGVSSSSPVEPSPSPDRAALKDPSHHQPSSHGSDAYQLNLGNMMHEEDEDIYYDEQATNGRWSTMRLIAAVAANGTADLTTEVYFIKDVDRSVQDPVYWVRREAAFAIGALARVVPIDFVLKDLVPMFERLVGDPHPDVRQNILFSLPPLVQRLPLEVRRKVTFDTLTALSEDPEITVRESALDTLSETIYAFANDPQGPPEFLLHMYLGRKEDKIVRNGTRLITFEIPPPLEAFYLDTKRPLTLAFGFPAVTLTLGKERWEELREAYLDLAANRMNDVKRSLAAGMGEIAKIIGADNTRRDLVQVWWNSINGKDSITRLRAIENIEALTGVVGKETGLSLWEGVAKNWEDKIFRVWRERKIILQELLKMPDLLGSEILPVIGIIEAQALLDAEQGVRDIAVENLPKILGLLSPQQDLLDGLNGAINQLLSSTFRRRMTFAACQRSIFLASVDGGQKPSVALTDDMLRVIFELSQDSVTDVKISVARFVGSVCDKFVRESESVPDLLAEIIQRLSQDSSLSVRSFIPDPATLLGGQQSVTFPSSSEFVEPTATLPAPGAPIRSRHFSKPPLPRLNSSVSAVDHSSIDVHLTNASANGVGMAVERVYGDSSVASADLDSQVPMQAGGTTGDTGRMSLDNRGHLAFNAHTYPSDDAMDIDNNTVGAS
ncbi:Serine/threonine-protein phosphatase 2A 65 kDa regulatory subunit A beta isoform [Leucoagaricus sp. SymC.cos]|nr:Serine/threonine-protein phosphatase 2A 65 kDa regulatory subunit A beta isoform [Leucoagaricus sp. SymC.cos]